MKTPILHSSYSGSKEGTKLAKQVQVLGNGVQFIKGHEKVIFSNGVVCSVAEFDAHVGKDLDKKLTEWEANPDYFCFDFAYARSTGVIRRKARVEVVEVPQTEKDITVKALDRIAVVKKALSAASIIIVVMTVVGVLSAFMSAYHTALALHIMGRSYLAGWVTGIVMILFSATAFTAGRFFLKEKGAVKLFSIVFFALGVTIIAYSMFSTLTVNYTRFKDIFNQETVEAVKNSTELDSYNERIVSLKERIKDTKEQIAKLEQEAEYWQKQSWKRYDSIQEQIDRLRERQRNAEDDLVKLQSEKPAVEANARQNVDNVFTFFARIMHVSSEMLQFLIQSIPAMFFDLIAPFALTCSLYLKDRKEEDYEYKEEI